MNTRIILIAGVFVAALSSCTTAYRTGQTPDDVYYSQGRETDAYVRVDREPSQGSRYETYYDNPDDRYLRMMVRNRSRWSAFDNYSMMDWRFNPYNSIYSPYGNFNNFNPHFAYGFTPMNPWGYSNFNSYWHWNSFYNPYYTNVVVLNPKTNPGNYQKIRNFNPGAYTNRNTYTPRANNGTIRPRLNSEYYTTPSNNREGNSRLGSSFKKVFSNPSNSNSNGRTSNGRYYSPGSASERPTRTYTPAPSRQSSSPAPAPARSSGGSSGGGVSRPSRGN